MRRAKSLFEPSRCASWEEGHRGVFAFDRVQECREPLSCPVTRTPRFVLRGGRHLAGPGCSHDVGNCGSLMHNPSTVVAVCEASIPSASQITSDRSPFFCLPTYCSAKLPQTR